MDSNFHNLQLQRKKFRTLVMNDFGDEDRKKIFAAFEFARKAHRKQKRDEGTAYIIHPLRVAIILLEDIGTWDTDVIVATLLHDVIEDCGISLERIRKRFGRRAANFVNAVTQKRGKKETEKQKEARKIKILLQMGNRPLEARLIKCADILDNIRCAADVPFYAPEREKFPRWHREFHQAVGFAKSVHPVLCREMQKALRIFDMKQVVRNVVRFGR